MEKAIKIMRNNTIKIIDDFDLGKLTFTEINIILYIGKQNKTMKELITEMAVANSTPTRIIDNLVGDVLFQECLIPLTEEKLL